MAQWIQLIMSPEPKEPRKLKVHKLLEVLNCTYPNAHCELVYSDPLQLLIATILSAQCTDKQVNKVTAHLFAKYPSAESYVQAPTSELETAIHSLGFFRNKAKNIQACCRALVEQHGGRVPREMNQLTTLAGVGRKTANVVLGNAFGINDGIVVDTHVARLARRLGLAKATTPETIEQELMEWVPREQWTLFSHWLIWHGRRRCSARNPDCDRCEVKEICAKNLP
jgi:endonuclease-3